MSYITFANQLDVDTITKKIENRIVAFNTTIENLTNLIVVLKKYNNKKISKRLIATVREKYQYAYLGNNAGSTYIHINSESYEISNCGTFYFNKWESDAMRRIDGLKNEIEKYKNIIKNNTIEKMVQQYNNIIDNAKQLDYNAEKIGLAYIFDIIKNNK